jgi:hypothetical protein
VNGVAKIRVELYPENFIDTFRDDLPNSNELDFGELRLSPNQGSCDFHTETFDQLGLTLAGCSSVTTSSKKPTGIAGVEEVYYPLLQESFRKYGRIYIESPQEHQRMVEQALEQDRELSRQMFLDLLPVIGTWRAFKTVFDECVRTASNGKLCNPFPLIGTFLLAYLDTITTATGVGLIARETFLTLKYYVELHTASRATSLATRATQPSVRAGLLASALEDIAQDAMRTAGSLDELAVTLRGSNQAIANVLESAGKCDLCLTRVETAIDGLKKTKNLTNKQALEWIAENNKKFSNGRQELTDNFVFGVLNTCIGTRPTQGKLEWCETMLNWRQSHGTLRPPKPFINCTENSFAANTPVATPQGLKPIAQIKLGDVVYTHQEASKQDVASRVLALHRHQDKKLTRLTLETGNTLETIETTQSHLFYVEDAQITLFAKTRNAQDNWIKAGELRTGMQIRRLKNQIGIVKTIINYKGSQEMFDLSISRNHNYFVGRSGWLVHNSLPCLLTYEQWRAIIKGSSTDGITGREWQVNHLFQDAAFGTKNRDLSGWIPYNDGPAIILNGSTSIRGTEHWAFHVKLEDFWDYWRALDDVRPTLNQYIEATEEALVNAGWQRFDAEIVTESMREWALRQGRDLTELVPRVPDPFPPQYLPRRR